MKKTPYDLYIHFEDLSPFWNECSIQEITLTCGLVSIELSTKLFSSINKRKEENNADLINQLLNGIETQLKLLNGFSYPTSFPMTSQDAHSKQLEQLKLVPYSFTNSIERISQQYLQLSQKLGFDLGLGVQFNQIRRHFGLSVQTILEGPKLDYHRFIDPVQIQKLSKTSYFNTEDELFMTVHQISECWFQIAINELKQVPNLFIEKKQNPPSLSTPQFVPVLDILFYLSEHILLLEHMILADYHPLRVALRGASGGQSYQAHVLFATARTAWETFLQLLKKEKVGIHQVLEQPLVYKELLDCIKYFEKLERALKTFFFNHYLLSASIIGSQSFGSIGYELVSLTNKFIEPIFKEIDQAKYDLTLKTNFQYGNFSGTLLLEKENFQPIQKQDKAIDIKVADQVIAAYFDAISELNSDKWIQLFAEDGYIEDPINSRPYIGHQELFVFFKGILRTFASFNMKIQEKQYDKNSVAVSWSATARSYNDKAIVFNGKEVFYISPEGKILAAQVQWDPSIIAKQL